MANKRVAYSIDEVCKDVNVGRSKIYEEIKSGRLLARKIGRRTLILADDLQTWLESLPIVEAMK